MKWEMEYYHNFQIWFGQEQGGDWIASVNALPEQGSGFTAGPGEGDILGPFKSREAIIEAAKRHIDERHRHRQSS